MKKNSKLIFVLALALTAGALPVFGGSATVADEAEAPAAIAAQSAVAEGEEGVASVAGMTIFIDRETGQLRPPTAEEAAILSDAMARVFEVTAGPAESFQQQTFAGGAVGVKLDLSQLVFSVATIGSDGTIDHECAPTAADALDHVHDHGAAEEDR